MVRRILGPVDVTGEQGMDLHRTYKVTWKVECELTDGPAILLQFPGLPAIGSRWLFGDDVDIWAWCTPEASVKFHNGNEPCDIAYITQTFTTKPSYLCQQYKLDNPLLEPYKVSIDSIDDKEEATTDRFGNALVTSSWEQLRGPAVEFAKSRSKYRIEQNVPLLQQELWEPMKNTLNDRPLWGLPRRGIRLAHAAAERKYYNVCFKYFTRSFEFEAMCGIHPKHGKVVSEFDRDVVDEGTKCLDGDWTPGGNYVVKKIAGKDANPLNPSHFKKFKDRQGSNTHVILDGRGKPYIPDPPTITIGGIVLPQFYDVIGFTKGALVIYNTRLTLQNPSPNPGTYPQYWSANVGTPAVLGVTLTLNINDVPPVYEFSAVGLQGHWFTLAGDWDPVGPNSMTAFDPAHQPAADEPYAITVIPGGTTTAGSRHIEYYGESNFLLLGIPLTF